ncbi:MAG: HD domain-containing protein [Euryarchaeota archaeon]|nr:HD domain-containing protein [Euryarchaeota archaeon]
MAARTRNKSQRAKDAKRRLDPGVVEVVLSAGRLKSRERRGWRQARLTARRFESVADHSWRVAFMAFLVAPPRIRRRAIELALLHDLAEAECGDITPRDGVPAKAKRRIEAAALETVLAGLHAPIASRVRRAHQEYSSGKSVAARLVKSLDKVEMAIEALALEREGADPETLETFWRSARRAATTKTGRGLMSGLEKARRTGGR